MTIAERQALETSRIKVQEEIDALHSPAERNRMGQFATPFTLALEITSFVKQLLDDHATPIHFADPALGSGVFFSALSCIFDSQQIKSASGIEIDPLFAEAAQRLWSPLGLNVIEGDFTQKETLGRLSHQPNLILANPPYVRHHHLDHHQKARLQQAVREDTRLSVNGLAGLYVYFILLAHTWMQEGGIAVWLIPSEFMDVNYGEILRHYLTDHVTLLCIHRFDPQNVQFSDALVSSAVVIFEKVAPLPGATAKFTFGGTLESPSISRDVSVDALRDSHKWTSYPSSAQTTEPRPDDPQAMLSDFFRIQRGIATGANQFFIMPRDEARSRGFLDDYLTPILPAPRYLLEQVIHADTDGFPMIQKQLVLIDCSEPEHEVRRRCPPLWEYFQTAKNLGVMDGYLVQKRQPWYRQERREPAPFLSTYIGRGSDQKCPFRFIWNHSSAVTPNVYLMIYPKEPLRSIVTQSPEQARTVFEFLCNITADDLRGQGRVYGGGLHKIEPAELGRIPAQQLVESIPELRGTYVRQLSLVF